MTADFIIFYLVAGFVCGLIVGVVLALIPDSKITAANRRNQQDEMTEFLITHEDAKRIRSLLAKAQYRHNGRFVKKDV